VVHDQTGGGVLAHGGNALGRSLDGVEQRGNGNYRSIRCREPEEVSLVSSLGDLKNSSQYAASRMSLRRCNTG
jgi:hypothetical protein